MKRIFGYELILDLYRCKVSVLSDADALREYAIELCEIIKMKRYEEPILKYFGTAKSQTKGYTLVQLIETSDITGHFSEYWKRAYINIFSCKEFDHIKARDFTEKYFGAKNTRAMLVIR